MYYAKQLWSLSINNGIENVVFINTVTLKLVSKIQTHERLERTLYIMTQHKTQHAVSKAKQTERDGWGGHRDCFTMEKEGEGAKIISQINMGRGWGGPLLHHTTKRDSKLFNSPPVFHIYIYMSVLTHFPCNSFLLIFSFLIKKLILLDQ